MSFKSSFKSRLHVLGYMIMINAVIAMLIACRYFVFLPEFPTDTAGLTFLITGTFYHMVMLSALGGLLLIPVLLLPQLPRRLIMAVVATLGLMALFIDTVVYAQYRFHINAVMLDLVMSSQIVSFPLSSWLMVIGGFLAVCAAQYFLICWLEKGIPLAKWKIGKKFAWLSVLTLLLSNAIHIWAAAHVYQPVTVTKRYLPVFYPMTSNKTMKKIWMD